MEIQQNGTSYTFADFLSWEGEGQFEIIHGEAFQMAPPSPRHQEVCGEIFRQLANFLEGKPCRPYIAPFGVRLFEKATDREDDVDIVVEPDISVVCDKSKIDNRGCKGAPDVVFEVLSSSTRRRDRLVKFNLYQEAHVKEYWIIDPISESVQLFLLSDNGYLRPFEDYGKDDIAESRILTGCKIDLKKVFGS